MATGPTANTFAEMLPKLMRYIADMKLAPDAEGQNLAGLVDLETRVMQLAKMPVDQVNAMLQQQTGGVAGGPAQPVPQPSPGGPGQLPPASSAGLAQMIASLGGAGGAMGGPPGGGAPGGPPGGPVGPGAPNPDEMRRMLGASR